MFDRLIDHLIPHEGNMHRPHILRARSAAFILLLALFLEALYLVGTVVILPRSSQFAAIIASVLVDQTNDVREAGNLSHLKTSHLLEVAATAKAKDMAAKGYFAHQSPGGESPWDWIERAGYDYDAAGENLAVNFTDSRDVTDAWMRSPLHRANILAEGYSEIGIGTAVGMYRGREAIFVVQMFGRPSRFARQNVPISTPPLASAGTTPTPSAQLASRTPTSLPIRTREVETVTPTTLVATSAPGVSGAAVVRTNVESIAEPRSFILELLSSPRTVFSYVLFLVGGIVVFALLLALFVRFKSQHADLIANGIAVLGVIAIFLTVNGLFAAMLGSI
jgi:hypothetical protein